jgi:hypothetical protein
MISLVPCRAVLLVIAIMGCSSREAMMASNVVWLVACELQGLGDEVDGVGYCT